MTLSQCQDAQRYGWWVRYVGTRGRGTVSRITKTGKVQIVYEGRDRRPRVGALPSEIEIVA